MSDNNCCLEDGTCLHRILAYELNRIVEEPVHQIEKNYHFEANYEYTSGCWDFLGYDVWWTAEDSKISIRLNTTGSIKADAPERGKQVIRSLEGPLMEFCRNLESYLISNIGKPNKQQEG